jgi:hypothetical protein
MLTWLLSAFMGDANSKKSKSIEAPVAVSSDESVNWAELVAATTLNNRFQTAGRILSRLLIDQERLALGLPVSDCAMHCPLRGTKRDRDAHNLADTITRMHTPYEDPEDILHDVEVGLGRSHWTIHALLDQLMPTEDIRQAAYKQLANSQKVQGGNMCRALASGASLGSLR